VAVRGFDGPESGERRAGGLWATPPLRAAREAAPVAAARPVSRARSIASRRRGSVDMSKPIAARFRRSRGSR